MKKFVNINLGGYPFAINVDAYEKMELYFESLEKYFSGYENPHEIIFDIEVRMAELFKENTVGNTILSISDVEEAIKILGTPEELSKEDIENEGVSFDSDYVSDRSDKKQSYKETYYRVGKKLFRDPDNKIIGGVSSGLSTYFGITDPIWIRLFFVILVLSGISPILYVILWIAIPTAKTEADFRAMRGEPIDIDVVARSIKDEFDNISDSFSDITSSFRNRKKSKRNWKRRKW